MNHVSLRRGMVVRWSSDLWFGDHLSFWLGPAFRVSQSWELGVGSGVGSRHGPVLDFGFEISTGIWIVEGQRCALILESGVLLGAIEKNITMFAVKARISSQFVG